jgi:magnesium-transporting ATPase (P-type)
VTLRSGPTGLSGTEVGSRLSEFGPNRIERLPTASFLTRLARQFTHVFAALLWTAALLALIADLWMANQGMGMVALRRLLPHQVRALRDGATAVTPTEDIVPGDVLFLAAGEDVPADCRLVEAFGVRVNNATVAHRLHGAWECSLWHLADRVPDVASGHSDWRGDADS